MNDTERAERDVIYRIRAARQHLNRKVVETGIENPLRDLAAHCRSVAFLETQPERRTELASIADGFEGLIGTFDRTNGRLWAVQQPGWTPEDASASGPGDRWRAAFESLHARILRDLPGDASELPQPDDKFWATQLDELVTYADRLYRETKGGE